jgi:hypothetical protein
MTGFEFMPEVGNRETYVIISSPAGSRIDFG